MATILTRPITRRIIMAEGRPLNVTLTKHGVEFREYKRKISFLYPYPVAFLHAISITLEARRRERDRAKGKRRKVKRGRKLTRS